ncbi:glycine cleavage system aminomethyltransferase GcvT [Methylobacterium sp. ID0610]|uniref:glycine cleavage system aminomethyltransferase GcvT n=1 Tax=Methylobacterium carpenticola TaxID=3344827 RepID=UPI0036D0B9A1
MSVQPAESVALEATPLHDLHLRLDARMVPFAGYAMPLQYPAGQLKEHLHTRAAAGLFDVSHMGQVVLRGDDPDRIALALERLIPADLAGLRPGRQRYGLLTHESGGILDDLMVLRFDDHLVVVVNAANKRAVIAHLRRFLPAAVSVEEQPAALIALQGPAAEPALAALAPEVTTMRFLDVREVTLLGARGFVARSGYTGEDGFEISVPAEAAAALAEALLAQPGVLPVGLGARDTLRLEAGLCLHGADIDLTTSPVEASLTFAIPKVRRRGGARAGGFPGETRILHELETGTARRRVGLRPEGRAPVRAGAPLRSEADGTSLGSVTSGSFGPSLGAPVAMGYVAAAHAQAGQRLLAEVRGLPLPLVVTPLPFLPATFKRA